MPLISTSPYQFIPDPNAFTLNNVSFVQSVPLNLDNNLRGSFLKPDGTLLFTTGLENDSVYAYDIPTPFDVSSMNGSLGDSFATTPKDTGPADVFFKPDGTRMFVTGLDNDEVIAYELSGAWDITTASLGSPEVVFDTNPQDTSMFALFFKPDGTKMYTSGLANNKIYEYNLSVAWDITSAAFLQDFSTVSTLGIYINPTGTKLFITNLSADTIVEHTLSTPWSISSASVDQSVSVSGQTTTPYGIHFKEDGTKMFIVGNNPQRVYEYNLT